MSEEEEEHKPDYWSSILSLEKNQERITVALEGVVSTLQDLRQSSRHEFETLDKRIEEHGKTKWSQIFGALGFALSVLVIIGGIIAWGYGRDIFRTNESLDDLDKAFAEHTHGGHPDSVKRELDGLRNLLDHTQKDLTNANDRVEKDVNNRIDRLEQALESGLYDFGGAKGPYGRVR